MTPNERAKVRAGIVALRQSLKAVEVFAEIDEADDV
jgi:hypothetical protein